MKVIGHRTYVYFLDPCANVMQHHVPVYVIAAAQECVISHGSYTSILIYSHLQPW